MSDLSTLQKSLIVLTIAIAVVFTFIFIDFHFGQRCALPEANSFGKRCGNAFSNWLYDFQTLISGVIAVLAAVLTVLQMRRSDNRQHINHVRAMKLNFYSQQATIAQNTQALRWVTISIAPKLILMKSVLGDLQNCRHNLYDNAESYVEPIRGFYQFVNSPVVERLEPLLGGEVAVKLQSARAAASLLNEFAKVCDFVDYRNPSEREEMAYFRFYNSEEIEIIKSVDAVCKILQGLSEELLRLQKIFGEPTTPTDVEQGAQGSIFRPTESD